MGLSRNKVAVSEGAAGSPPFYGERVLVRVSAYFSKRKKTRLRKRRDRRLLFDFQRTKRKKEKDHTDEKVRYGGVAQLGEHLPCKQGVKGSIPFISTSPKMGEGRVEKPATKRRKLNGLIAQVVRARA